MIIIDEHRSGYLDTLTDTLWGICERACGLLGFEIVDVEALRGRGRLLVRFYIDREGGVGIDDCAAVSRTIERLLDAKDPIDGPYTIEVSSPGLERPVRKETDFIKFAGREIKIKTRAPIAERTNFSGVLMGIVDGLIVVKGDDGQEFKIPQDIVKRARLVYR